MQSTFVGQPILKSIRIIEELAKKNDVKFLNYGDDVRFQKPEYFQDASHLNDTGGKEYSKVIVSMLSSL